MNVYQAALNRLSLIFEQYENVLVSFSGGKDSGVLLNLCYEFAKEHDLLDKLAMYHLDYEAQYSFTTEYVTRTFERFNDIRRFWLCLPISANCACKMDSNLWIPWDADEKDRWCRKIPRFSYVYTEHNVPFEFVKGTYGKDTKQDFCNWFASQYGKTAVMIGIRADESFDRQNAIRQHGWIVGKENPAHKVYPIYDWKTSDVWIANARFNWDYNCIYDLFYKAGLTINQMRVANPFHTCGLNNLKLYRVIEPQTWSKLLNRVNGVNFGRIYGGTSAVAFKNLTKPGHFTWEQYAVFLVETSTAQARDNYRRKITEFVMKWKRQGYPDGIPDEADYFMEKKRDVPSWRRVCKCILTNDFACKGLGFSQGKVDISCLERA